MELHGPGIPVSLTHTGGRESSTSLSLTETNGDDASSLFTLSSPSHIHAGEERVHHDDSSMLVALGLIFLIGGIVSAPCLRVARRRRG